MLRVVFSFVLLIKNCFVFQWIYVYSKRGSHVKNYHKLLKLTKADDVGFCKKGVFGA